MIPLITLTADDPHKLAEFYDGLHATFVTWGKRSPGVPWKQVGTRIEILRPDAAGPKAMRGRLSMLVDDMDTALAHVLRKGGSLVLPPRSFGTRTIAMIRDPGGNAIGLHGEPFFGGRPR